MYRKQIAAALGLGLLVGVYLTGVDASWAVVISGVLATIILLRWLFATTGRVRYWKSRSNRHYRKECPNCNGQRHRLHGDWILTCGQCGWRPGLPVLRWFQYSIPAIQFRRSASSLQAFLFGVSATVLALRMPASLEFTVPVVLVGTVLPNQDQILLFVVAVFVVFIAIAYALRPRRWYCQKCGQDRGTGKPSRNNPCPNCGSNRVTTEDPGVADKVQVHMKD